MDAQIDIVEGRIERMALDAVVNAANMQLLPGSGVDGALRAAAGPELTRLTQTLPPLSPSQAVITPGFNGPFKHIIHVAAPIWYTPGDKTEKVFELGHCYINAIRLAEAHGLKSIAFPFLGTGVYGWPPSAVCGVSITHVYAGLAQAPGIERVVFCCFTAEHAALYRKGMRGEL
jgi:O-acetyl-ADP-ribose deacetylase (regulator of RNase III)